MDIVVCIQCYRIKFHFIFLRHLTIRSNRCIRNNVSRDTNPFSSIKFIGQIRIKDINSPAIIRIRIVSKNIFICINGFFPYSLTIKLGEELINFFFRINSIKFILICCSNVNITIIDMSIKMRHNSICFSLGSFRSLFFIPILSIYFRNMDFIIRSMNSNIITFVPSFSILYTNMTIIIVKVFFNFGSSFNKFSC